MTTPEGLLTVRLIISAATRSIVLHAAKPLSLALRSGTLRNRKTFETTHLRWTSTLPKTPDRDHPHPAALSSDVKTNSLAEYAL